MVTNKEYRIKKIVAVWNNNPTKELHVLPPCGACRQSMLMLSEDALDDARDDARDIEVVLGHDTSGRLAELLPSHEWPDKEDLPTPPAD
jgi:cytidine deaminase